MKRYRLEKDGILNKWVVFEKVGLNAWNQVYASNRKKDCEVYMNNRKNFKKNLKHIKRELDKVIKNVDKTKRI